MKIVPYNKIEAHSRVLRNQMWRELKRKVFSFFLKEVVEPHSTHYRFVSGTILRDSTEGLRLVNKSRASRTMYGEVKNATKNCHEDRR